MSATSQSQKYDVTIFGATGFVGKICVRHFVDHPQYAEGGFTWAVAGRSAKKLSDLKKGFKLPENVGILEADTADPARRNQLEELVKRSRVIINLVGPYGDYGSFRLAELCAQNGTHYTDLSGESAYNSELVEKLHEVAKRNDSILFASAGFDSVPFDVVVYLGVKKVLEQAQAAGKTVGHIEAATGTLANGSFSGGTVASLRYMAGGSDKWQLSPKRPLAIGAPLYQQKSNAAQPSHKLHVRPAQWLPQFQSYGFPSPFAMHNSRTIYHSAALLETEGQSPVRYSSTFQVIDVLATSSSMPWPVSYALCHIIASISVIFGFLVSKAWFRSVLARLIPVGSGPSDKSQSKGYADLRGLVVGWPSAEVAKAAREGQSDARPVTAAVASWTALKADPGYLMTARLICEVALLIVFDRRSSSKLSAGVRTGATLDVDGLTERLHKYAQIQIGVKEWTKKDVGKSIL